MQAHQVIRVFVPGVRDEFLDLLGIGQIDFMNFGQIAVDNRAARHQQIRRRIVVGVIGNVAVRQQALPGNAAPVSPAFVESGDSQ